MRLVEIDRLLGENEAVRQAQASLQEAKDRSAKWKAQQKDLELERQKLAAEAAAAENRLYSGKVHNPRELTDLQDKMSELGKRRESLEDPLIEAMLEAEQAEADITARQQALEKVLAKQASTMSSLNEERASSLAQLEQLRGEVDAQRKEIDLPSLQQYDTLRKQPRGIAVAKLSREGECTMCGVGLTTALRQQARHSETITCPTCGRILVYSA
jgi:predicted  nucleic acid-binding Zn-ribbon protein